MVDWQGGKHTEQSSAAAGRGVCELEGACTSKGPKVYSWPWTLFSPQIGVVCEETSLLESQVFRVRATNKLVDLDLIRRN